MKRGKVISVLVVLSLFLLPLVPAPTVAQGGYTEKITVYVAGSSAAWFITIGDANVTNTVVQSAEALPGLNSYNLTAIRSTSWSADFQVFGSQGYNVLPVSFVPPEGAFLTVNAASYATAASAASKFGSYLVTSFKSTSNASGTFTFLAPLSFPEVVPLTLLKLVPFTDGGFLTPVNGTGFLSLSSPMVTLSAQKTSGGGFTHQVSVGSITAAGLDSTSKPNILNYFGQAQASLQAGNKSTSSVIDMHFLNGLVYTNDGAKISTNRAAFTSTYTLTVKAGSKVKAINATVLEQPPELLATRVVDVGVLKQGSNMSVTINLTNLSNSTILTGISLNDSWWQSQGGFKLVRGNSSVALTSLAAGASSSPTYVLQYTGNATKQVQLAPTQVRYVYQVGSLAQVSYTNLNPMTISLGADAPVVVAYVVPSSSFPTPVGGNQSLRIQVKNVGTRAASSVTVAGQQLGGLAADGGSSTVSLTATAPSITQVNVTKSYSVTYTSPSGQALSTNTNTLSVVFTQTGLRLGLGILTLNSTISQLTGGAGYSLTLTYGLTSLGTASINSFTATTPLPAGLSCGKMSSNLTCSGNSMTLSYKAVPLDGKEQATASFNVTQASSFVFWPTPFTYTTSGIAETGFSNAQPAPTGLLISKNFDPSVFFPGMTSHVTALARNAGPFTIFNATLATTADSFDSLSTNATTVKSAPSLAQGGNLNFSYTASIGNSKGSQTTTPAAAKFFMGGTPFTVTTSSPTVKLNQPPAATITTSPANPVEGAAFSVSITVTNPASVGVTGVKLTLPIPSGVSVSNLSNSCNCATYQHGDLTITLGSLGPGSSASSSATVSASSGQTIPFKPATLTFSYANQTLSGKLPSGGIAVSESVGTRYLLPIGMAFLAMIVVAYEVRKMARPSVPASQQ